MSQRKTVCVCVEGGILKLCPGKNILFTRRFRSLFNIYFGMTKLNKIKQPRTAANSKERKWNLARYSMSLQPNQSWKPPRGTKKKVKRKINETKSVPMSNIGQVPYMASFELLNIVLRMRVAGYCVCRELFLPDH